MAETCLSTDSKTSQKARLGKNLASSNGWLGKPKPLNSSLPIARIFISNLLCLGPRKTLVFLGF
jgi:hypothetical protein